MSLFDIDAGSEDRGSPSPQKHDQLPDEAVKAHQTIGTTYKTDASSANVRMIFKNNLLLQYDDKNRIISVFGTIPQVAAYPILITAQYGYDVFTDVLGIARPTGL